jgi:hypothetical protein
MPSKQLSKTCYTILAPLGEVNALDGNYFEVCGGREDGNAWSRNAPVINAEHQPPQLIRALTRPTRRSNMKICDRQGAVEQIERCERSAANPLMFVAATQVK